jgi:hypothetical protein
VTQRVNGSSNQGACSAPVVACSSEEGALRAALVFSKGRAILVLEGGAKLSILFTEAAHVVTSKLCLLATVDQHRRGANHGQMCGASKHVASRKAVLTHSSLLRGG